VVGVVLALGGTALATHMLTGPDTPPRPPADQAILRARSGADPASSTPARSATGAATPGPASTPGQDFGPVLPDARPISLDVPAIGLHTTRLVDLAYDDAGALEVPTDFASAGWFTPGPSPGQLGPAVIAGHVDSTAGPAVFYRLGDLRRGDAIRVRRDDGTTASFVVDRVEEYPKDRFPTGDVYGNTTDRAELRLITCGGDFDHRTGHYVDNVVVFAHLVDA
jgi:Sortase domain